MSDYQCQHCGQLIEAGHNCDGKPFVFSPSPQKSIQATSTRKELLERKGFHEDGNLDGVFYRHPMYGLVAVYPGGAFRTAYVETTLALDAYLESLLDSSYTDIGPAPYETRCDACKGVGSLFPDAHFRFPHKDGCLQAK
jgi:hypothetical protein